MVSGAPAHAKLRLISCKVSKLKTTVQIKALKDLNGEASEFRFITKEYPNPNYKKVVDEFNVPKQQIESDPYLAKIARASGIVELRNVMSAKAYITDSDNMGMSGLMVFVSGPNRSVSMAFFAAGVDLALACKQ